MSPPSRDPKTPPQVRTEGDRRVPALPEASVATFRSAVTEAIGVAVGFPVAVIAITDDPHRLARHLTATWHAAWSASPGGHLTPFAHEPFTASDVSYAPSPVPDEWLRHRPLPPGVSLVGGTLRVALPAGSDADDLGPLFEIAMDDRRFDVVAGHPAHVARRHASGRHVPLGPRYSGRPGTSLRSMTLVRNLYAFRPQDLHDVAAAAALAVDGLAIRCDLSARARAADLRERVTRQADGS